MAAAPLKVLESATMKDKLGRMTDTDRALQRIAITQMELHVRLRPYFAVLLLHTHKQITHHDPPTCSREWRQRIECRGRRY